MKLPRITRRSIVLSVSFIAASILVLTVDILIFTHPVWLALTAAWHWLSLAAAWHWYQLNRDDVTPLGTFALAAVVAWAALAQARTARLRHEKQTKGDVQRRITESFSKAAEMLGDDKIEVRLGGIYTMERISQESPEDYWPVMETLTAFVRERARWQAPNEDESESLFRFRPDEPLDPPIDSSEISTDIAAVLSVIRRRGPANREREKMMGWRFDLRGTDLRGAQLVRAHLERAVLHRTHLEYANLNGAHLEHAILFEAHLKGADLQQAYLDGAGLFDADLSDADLQQAHLDGAHLEHAHLDGADLRDAIGLKEDQLAAVYGDFRTKLPAGMEPPATWLPAQG